MQPAHPPLGALFISPQFETPPPARAAENRPINQRYFFIPEVGFEPHLSKKLQKIILGVDLIQ